MAPKITNLLGLNSTDSFVSTASFSPPSYPFNPWFSANMNQTLPPPSPFVNISPNWVSAFLWVNTKGVTADITLDYEFSNILFMERAYNWGGGGGMSACVPNYIYINNINNVSAVLAVNYRGNGITYNAAFGNNTYSFDGGIF